MSELDQAIVEAIRQEENRVGMKPKAVCVVTSDGAAVIQRSALPSTKPRVEDWVEVVARTLYGRKLSATSGQMPWEIVTQKAPDTAEQCRGDAKAALAALSPLLSRLEGREEEIRQLREEVAHTEVVEEMRRAAGADALP